MKCAQWTKMHNIHSKMNHVYGIYSKILITFNMYNAICGVSVNGITIENSPKGIRSQAPRLIVVTVYTQNT